MYLRTINNRIQTRGMLFSALLVILFMRNTALRVTMYDRPAFSDLPLKTRIIIFRYCYALPLLYNI